MQRFHLYRHSDMRIYAVEVASEWSEKIDTHAQFERLSEAPVSPEDAIRSVLESGGVVLRHGRRPWRSDTGRTAEDSLAATEPDLSAS